MRRYGKKWNSPENKKKRSEAGRKGALARWGRYHAALADEPVRADPPADLYRLTFEDLVTGQCEVLLFHPTGKRQFRIDVNGRYWRTCGWTGAVDRFRKSCVSINRQ